ncbi:MAG: hypothetical protein CMF63_09660 [Magnetovibrio sp.]|jgi:RNA polymerase sigma-70 factor (ECF subfamily)|nr:hypothetical protein [Magnetovibrio sp.]|tara:strand:+ start:367 stop:936 length:570 start_codon:yes stop_codon:yes gene_type:complete
MTIQDHLQTLLASATFHANRLVHRLNLPSTERDDIRQDLLVEMIARLRRFDPGKASISTFIDLVARNGASAIARRYRREQRLLGMFTASIDDDRSGSDGLSLIETLSEEDGLAAILGGADDAFALADLAIDTARAERSLSGPLRDLCALLKTEAPSAAWRKAGLSRATFYRRLRELRLHFRAEGLRLAA